MCTRQQGRDRVDLAKKQDAVADAKFARFVFRLDAFRAITDHHQDRRNLLVHARVHRHNIAHALDRAKIRDVHQHLPPANHFRRDGELM